MNTLAALLFIVPTLALAGNEGPNPGVLPADACGSPYRLDYVDLVKTAGIEGCGKDLGDFRTTSGGSISRINGLKDPNLYYSVLVQNIEDGTALSSVVKCDVKTGKASLLTLDFAAKTTSGGCTVPRD